MARAMMDVGLDSDDLRVNAGDWVSVESTAAHQTGLILDGKGDWKQNPTIAVGAMDYLNDQDPGDLVNAIAVEFAKDGMNVKSVYLGSDGVIHSDAYYS